ncbi:MAG: hypothetical protein methR_P3024 [Methyloprofundus sp.]|nr:MAG: hypothetical protein methR_P3024 [Methyloprofundus sp.]
MPKSIIKEYIETIDSLYGVFFDSCQGFESAKNTFQKSQLETLRRNQELEKNKKPSNPTIYHTTIEALDSACLIYSKGDKSEDNYRRLHYCPTQDEYKKRNSPEGENYRFIGNMTLISIFEYWESSCRNKLASHHNIHRKYIKSHIMGDLRHIRNSIIHHRGIALPEINKCKTFGWYKENDGIFIDGDQMEDIISAIKESKLELYYVAK